MIASDLYHSLCKWPRLDILSITVRIMLLLVLHYCIGILFQTALPRNFLTHRSLLTDYIHVKRTTVNVEPGD